MTRDTPLEFLNVLMGRIFDQGLANPFDLGPQMHLALSHLLAPSRSTKSDVFQVVHYVVAM